MNVREWALPVYTILMQMAVGSLFMLWLIRSFAASRFSHHEIERIISNPLLVVVFTTAVAMVAAHFHLSHPFHSFLAVMNFKSSWLSREIVFSISFFMTLMGLLYFEYFQTHRRVLITVVGWLAIVIGTVLIYCMARIYLIPTQIAWNSTTVIFSFYITALMLGCMSIACLMVLDLRFAEIQRSDDVDLRADVIRYSFSRLTLMVILLAVLSIVVLYIQMRLLSQGGRIARTSLDLLLELYLPLLVMRLVFLIFSSGYLGVVLYRIHRIKITPQGLFMPVYVSCLLLLISEIVGRFLFYATHIRVGI